MDLLWNILQESWHIWMEASVYLLGGFLVAGLLYGFLSPDTISHHLGKGKISSVFLAAFFGTPLPLCSCGVVPAAVSLKKSGANNGAVLSFLISTPVTGVDSIAVTYTLMDPIMTVARPVSGFLTAVVAGLIENITSVFSKKKPAVVLPSSKKDCCEALHQKTVGKKFSLGMRYAFVDLMADISRWFLVGMLAAGMITVLIPDAWFHTYMGGGLAAMLLMLLAGVPLYICAAASTPIAAALILKGASAGTALVFLLGGSATNIASVMVIAKFLGKKATLIYLLTIATLSVAFGLALDQIYLWLGRSPEALSGTATHIFPHWLVWGASLLVVGLMLNGLRLSFKKDRR